MIEFKNVTKKYGDVTALNNINLTIEKGEIYGVIGFSGAGKSSLIRCVNFLEEPTSGDILINGISLKNLSAKELRSTKQKIGMVFQHFNLLNSKTVYDNVAMPLIISNYPKKEIENRVLELLMFVGLSDKAQNYPSELSGGQKQRVGIARSLATQPEILLCDEATSALDPETTKQILNLLKKVNKEYNITILLITHEMEVIRNICDNVAILEKGKIIEANDVFSVFSNPQKAVTKKFINSDGNFTLPAYITNLVINDKQILYRINFIGDSVSKPLLSEISKKFDVHINVLYGNITELQSIPYGSLVVNFDGEENKVNNAIDYILKQKVEIKEISC